MATFGSYVQAGSGTRASRGPSNNIQNVALGYNALASNSSGTYNTAIGVSAVRSTNGNRNVGIGTYTLYGNGGSCNIAIGYEAGRGSNSSNNVFIGFRSGWNNGGSGKNVFIGARSGVSNGGYFNVGLGFNNQTYTPGSFNVTIGTGAQIQYAQNCGVAVGLGSSAGRCGVAIGFSAYAGGNASIAIAGFVSYSYHTTWGKGSFNYNWVRCTWSNLSDCRDKTAIKDLDNNLGLNFLRKLTPVSFNFDNRSRYVDACKFEYGVKDGTLTKRKKNYGFIAQEIKSIKEELNVRFDALGYTAREDAYRVTYEEFIAPLVKGIQQTLARLENLESRV